MQKKLLAQMLVKTPSSFYLDKFNPDKIKVCKASIEPYFRGTMLAELHGDIKIDFFRVCFETQDRVVPSTLIEQAREVLNLVFVLDERARKIFDQNEEEHQYELRKIEMRDREAIFCYASLEVNSTWEAFFERADNGNWVWS